MIDSLERYTPERKSRYDNIYRSYWEDLSDMSRTELMDITILTILASEFYDTLRIVLDDDELRTRRLVLDEIFGECSISGTEFDNSTRPMYLGYIYHTACEPTR